MKVVVEKMQHLRACMEGHVIYKQLKSSTDIKENVNK